MMKILQETTWVLSSLLVEGKQWNRHGKTQMLARDLLFNSVAPEAVGTGFAWQ